MRNRSRDWGGWERAKLCAGRSCSLIEREDVFELAEY